MMRTAIVCLLLLVGLAAKANDDEEGYSPNLLVMSYDFTYNGRYTTYSGIPSGCWTFETSVGATLPAECAGTTVLTVAGNPSKVTDATYPTGIGATSPQGYAYRLDGTGDYLSVSNGAGGSIYNPAGAFSIFVVITPTTGFTTGDTIVSKGTPTANQRGWRLYASTATTAAFAVTDDGTSGVGHMTTLTRSTAFAVGRQACIVASYSGGVDGAISGFLLVDSLAATTSAVMDGPVYANSGPLTLGADGDTTGDAPMEIHHFEYLGGAALTQAEALYKCRYWYGTTAVKGSALAITYSVPAAFPYAPPDSGTEPWLLTPAPNCARVGSPETGRGGLYGSSSITNNLYRAQICKTVSGGHPSTGGWAVPTEAPGDGSADVVCSTTRYAEGYESLRMDLVGTTSVAQQCSICYTSASVIAAKTYFSAQVLPSANSTPVLTLEEYDTAACGTLLATNTATLVLDTPGWDSYGGAIAAASWNASTSSYRICMTETCNGGCTTYWDAPQLRASGTPSGTSAIPTDGFCGGNADSTAACGPSNYAFVNPIPPVGKFEIEQVRSSPSDGTDTVYTLVVPKTGGSFNNRIQWVFSTFTLYDSLGVAHSVSPGVSYSYASNHEFKAVAWRDTNLIVSTSVDDYEDGTVFSGGATDAMSATGYIGGTAANYNVWTRYLKIRKKVTGTTLSGDPNWYPDTNYWSVVQLADTQIVAESWPAELAPQVEWIINHATEQKTGMVMHLGDVVNTENIVAQWTVSDTEFSKFDAASLAWMVTPGNHDYVTPWSSDPSAVPTTFLSYFGPTRFELKPYWGGHSLNELNTWTTISLGGVTYIFLMLELDTPAAAITWAESIITAHLGVPVIVGTHQYLLDDTQARSTVPVIRTGGVGGDTLWAMLKTHDEVRMVLCGHYVNASGDGHLTSLNDAGHDVHQIISNYQERYHGSNQLVRLYRIYPALNMMQVRTYSVRTGMWGLGSLERWDTTWR
jgi:hypothetical protein